MYIDVCVPCFVPHKCKKYDSVGRQQLVPGSKNIIVVTLEGKYLPLQEGFSNDYIFMVILGCFNLQSANFSCNDCNEVTEADKFDYVGSGFLAW